MTAVCLGCVGSPERHRPEVQDSAGIVQAWNYHNDVDTSQQPDGTVVLSESNPTAMVSGGDTIFIQWATLPCRRTPRLVVTSPQDNMATFKISIGHRTSNDCSAMLGHQSFEIELADEIETLTASGKPPVTDQR